eukprot:TRINITY_DN1029_c0_g3_i1.p1 TRINITY_DN1029_c0_g3~~TRINITY_DN1029_c0_g3_i1.p1  ORF type:complete len:235 (+),score=76.93 TRINITY_DN1029_c0_g3_i1:54-707(+)
MSAVSQGSSFVSVSARRASARERARAVYTTLDRDFADVAEVPATGNVGRQRPGDDGSGVDAPPLKPSLRSPSKLQSSRASFANDDDESVQELSRLRRENDRLRLDRQQLEEHNLRYSGMVKDRDDKLRKEREQRRAERTEARQAALLETRSLQHSVLSESGSAVAPQRRTRAVDAASEVQKLRTRAKQADDLEKRVEELEKKLEEQQSRSACACIVA